VRARGPCNHGRPSRALPWRARALRRCGPGAVQPAGVRLRADPVPSSGAREKSARFQPINHRWAARTSGRCPSRRDPFVYHGLWTAATNPGTACRSRSRAPGPLYRLRRLSSGSAADNIQITGYRLHLGNIRPHLLLFKAGTRASSLLLGFPHATGHPLDSRRAPWPHMTGTFPGRRAPGLERVPGP